MNMNTVELTVSASELSRPRASVGEVTLTDRSDGSAAGCGDPALHYGMLTDAERQPCEVWTRVMGYHRPVSSFNTGKKAEHAERRFFSAGK